MKLPKNATLIGAVVILVAGIVAYVFFFGNKKDATLSEIPAPTTAAEVTFLNLSDQITKITFDTTLFKDPRFLSLVDISVMVVPEAPGRKDPFAAF